MNKNRLEAFSDGVLAIIITVMVLELKVPAGHTPESLLPLLPELLSYALSYVYVGIYWNNHHHMLHAARSIDGRIMWANLHLLFWLSLIPFSTAWFGQSGAGPFPTAVYGTVLLFAAIAYWLLQQRIIAHDGKDSPLARAVGRDVKGRLSPMLYALAIGLAFVSTRISVALFVLVALIWLVPDRRIERREHEPHGP